MCCVLCVGHVDQRINATYSTWTDQGLSKSSTVTVSRLHISCPGEEKPEDPLPGDPTDTFHVQMNEDEVTCPIQSGYGDPHYTDYTSFNVNVNIIFEALKICSVLPPFWIQDSGFRIQTTTIINLSLVWLPNWWNCQMIEHNLIWYGDIEQNLADSSDCWIHYSIMWSLLDLVQVQVMG